MIIGNFKYALEGEIGPAGLGIPSRRLAGVASERFSRS
jgi:hypothetical protein